MSEAVGVKAQMVHDAGGDAEIVGGELDADGDRGLGDASHGRLLVLLHTRRGRASACVGVGCTSGHLGLLRVRGRLGTACRHLDGSRVLASVVSMLRECNRGHQGQRCRGVLEALRERNRGHEGQRCRGPARWRSSLGGRSRRWPSS
jgi:hypothetical protein